MIQPRYACALKISPLALAMAMLPIAAGAMQFDTGDPDLRFRWDNTVKYTAAFRVAKPDSDIATTFTQPNVDGGDSNFDRGMINNRIDLFSEADLSYKNRIGARVSAAAWYDSVYRRNSTDFTGSPIPNTLSTPNGQFTKATKELMGQKAEMREAFIYGNGNIAGKRVSARFGRLTQLFGETLFLGANGIAYAQGPVDLITAFSQPNAQFKEIALPVRQMITNLQISPTVTIDAYYQFEWRPIRLPATGSYYSPADFVGDGADLILLPPPVPGADALASRGVDYEGKDRGQFGGQVRVKVPNSDVEVGLYAAKYDEKLPVPVVTLGRAGAAGPHSYNLFYGRDIKVYGASVSTLLGETNVAMEVSTRRNTPLAPLGDLIVSLDPTADNEKNTPYARGNTLHANISAITVFPATSFYDAGSFVGEFAYNRLLDVTHNPVDAVRGLAKNSTSTRDHAAFRAVFQPEYFQVAPGLDLQVPIGLSYGAGRSAVFQAAPDRGGDMSVGVNFDYQKTWQGGLNFTHYYGPKGPAPSMVGGANTNAGYTQYFGDRDFVSLSIKRTF